MSLNLYADGVANAEVGTFTTNNANSTWSPVLAGRRWLTTTTAGAIYYRRAAAKTGEDIVNDAIIDLMIREYVQGRRDGIDPA